MNYLTFGNEEKTSYKICILVNHIRRDEILRAYVEPYGLDPEEILVLDLHQARGQKKTPAAEMKAYIAEELAPVLADYRVEHLLVGDGDYFKTLAKKAKVDSQIGYVLASEFGPWTVTYVPNFRTVFYDPEKVTAKIACGVHALKSWIQGTYKDPGVEIIKFAAYPDTVEDIAYWLQRLRSYAALSCDIEAFSLKHYDAGIGTITFCWSQHEGIAFPVDLLEDEADRLEVRSLLKAFFETYQGRLLFHHISYDVTVLIFQLFMAHILDNEGLLRGLEVMLRCWEDTKLITYLATNSCAGNKLGLKDQAQEFAGDYSQGDAIKDIRKIPLPQLLQYNLIDGLSTWFVYHKHWDRMVQDQQHLVYENLFKLAIVDIIQMQLTGMPVDMAQVAEVEEILQAGQDQAVADMRATNILQSFTYRLREEHVEKRNGELKKKRISLADAETLAVEFNPNSGPQLIKLLYEHVGLPVISTTESKQPSTDGDTLEALRNHTSDPDVLGFLDGLIAYKAVNKILTSFIPALKGAVRGPDGWYYLFGNFNLGGTVSGRLSSSDPNLQNLPANVVMKLTAVFLTRFGERVAPYVEKDELLLGKLVKSCFKAPPGWHFVGIDFNSLEDRISALTTKDPNKLRVYTDGYDGHSLRAHAYFGDQMPDIDPDSVESINSIQKKYKPLRQDSKAPTFALTYQGTYVTLMANCGFSEAKAKAIEARYHEFYAVSDQWVADRLDRACKDGYVTAAFGLRVRTPLLHQVIRGTRKTPFEAEAEGRTAGNALGQSWCLLNTRAGSDFLNQVRGSERFRLSVKPCAQIHDAQYFLVRDDLEVMAWVNERVVKACEWQDHPEIWHDEVKLGGELSIFWPNWSQEVGIHNGASEQEILDVFTKHVLDLQAAG